MDTLPVARDDILSPAVLLSGEMVVALVPAKVAAVLTVVLLVARALGLVTGMLSSVTLPGLAVVGPMGSVLSPVVYMCSVAAGVSAPRAFVVLVSPGVAANVVSTGGFTVVSTTAGTTTLWFVAVGEALRDVSVGPASEVSLAVVSRGVTFPKLPSRAVAALGEAVSTAIVGADRVAVCPPSCSMGAVGKGDSVEVKMVLFGGCCVTLCLLVPLGELPATAAVEGTLLTTVVATGVLA